MIFFETFPIRIRIPHIKIICICSVVVWSKKINENMEYTPRFEEKMRKFYIDLK